MKKIIYLILTFTLILTFIGCTDNDAAEPEPLVNPINLSMEIINSADDLNISDFPEVDLTEFKAEEGSTVLDATELFCIANDITLSKDSAGTYIKELNGITEGDYSDMTGWIFKINGEMGNLGANEEIIKAGDKISWEFIDFSNYSW